MLHFLKTFDYHIIEIYQNSWWNYETCHWKSNIKISIHLFSLFMVQNIFMVFWMYFVFLWWKWQCQLWSVPCNLRWTNSFICVWYHLTVYQRLSLQDLLEDGSKEEMPSAKFTKQLFLCHVIRTKLTSTKKCFPLEKYFSWNGLSIILLLQLKRFCVPTSLLYIVDHCVIVAVCSLLQLSREKSHHSTGRRL